MLRLIPGQLRLAASSRATHSLSLCNDEKHAQWNRALSKAEKIVGVPSSTFTWNVLTTEGGVGAAGYIRKLLSTTHPLIKTIKGIVHNGRTNLQTRGLIVLLMSRCAGHIEGSPKLLQGEWEEAATDGVTARQKNMSEIVEMVYASHLIHRDVVNVSRQLIKNETLLDELNYGNKIAILVGDVLISNASKKTAELDDCKVLDLIAGAIGDFMKSEFVVRHDSFGVPLPTIGMSSAQWERRTFLSNGSLLANACQSVVLMAGHGENVQRRAKEFGMSLGFAWQLQYELRPFVDMMFQAPGVPFNLTSLPAILYFQRNPHILNGLESLMGDLGKVDYADLFEQICQSGCVAEARHSLDIYVDTAISKLEDFDSCYKAKDALAEIVTALR